MQREERPHHNLYDRTSCELLFSSLFHDDLTQGLPKGTPPNSKSNEEEDATFCSAVLSPSSP